jgi:preprotein translocase subunit YajC
MSSFGLIPSAYAQAATPQAASPLDMLQSFAPFIIVIGIFYFLLIRPQQQRQKQLKTQLSQLRRGDSVVTAGGIIGTVARVVSDDEVMLDIAEGVRVRVVRATITGINAKGEPRSDVPDAEPPAAKGARRGKTITAAPVATAPANESKPQS